MARQTQIEKAIAKLDADIEAIEKKAHDDIAVLQLARKRLVETQKAQPKRATKARSLPGSVAELPAKSA